MTAVIRITELQLPLAEKSVENTPEEIRAAILKRLGIDASSLIDFSVFKRSYDARKKREGIRFVYIVDVTARDETSILRRHVNDRHIRQTRAISPHFAHQYICRSDRSSWVSGPAVYLRH